MGISSNAEEKGVIAKAYENDSPVIYTFVEQMPSEQVRHQLPWLTVISWTYDGSTTNGMPLETDNAGMMRLEDVIEDNIENDGVLRHSYSRTGNNLKELVYYIHDQNLFLAAFNSALESHPKYPIKITFYKDEKWEEFQRLLNKIKK